MAKNNQTVLITDDIEINRALLADMLGGGFNILEAESGAEAVSILHRRAEEIDLVLLDMVMPVMDGFEVLAVMNRNGWIKDIPVIMISAETSSSYIERAYELGVTEFINRPFDAFIVRRRVMNTLMLSGKQKKLAGLVTDQIYEREKMNGMMITVLSHIVEFRNGESGLHVLHINTISDMLIRNIVSKTDKYRLTQTDISLIATASALHDIGKLGVPDEILNKPGKLTPEEFAVMKTHTTIGADMLGSLDFLNDEKLIKYALEICRWHHERYDGRGYPDGLKGEEIPISAQIVSIADVYDALTSERVYKKAFSHATALQMIENGECGAFNPFLVECLKDIAPALVDELKINSLSINPYKNMKAVTDEVMRHDELSTSFRTLNLLENERIKNRFYAEISKEIQFEYVCEPSMLMLYNFGERRLDLGELVLNPEADKKVNELIGEDNLKEFINLAKSTTPDNFSFTLECRIILSGECRFVSAKCRALFNDAGERTGIIGKITDITNEHAAMNALKHKATRDQLTFLYNGETAREQICAKLAASPETDFVMVMIDVDYFKTINDTRGHEFGNRVLKHISRKLREGLRRADDIIARFGGDEFLAFFQSTNKEATVKRIFNLLTERFEDTPVSVSMGVADTADCGRDFKTLFNCADKAAYEAKRLGKNRFCFYSAEVEENSTTVSTIDAPDEKGAITLKNGRELREFLKELKKAFNAVRLFDFSVGKRYIVEDNGKFIKTVADEGYVYGSRNAVTARALMTKHRASGLVYRGNEVYAQISFFVEAGDQAYVLEIISLLNEDMLGGAVDKAKLITAINRASGGNK